MSTDATAEGLNLLDRKTGAIHRYHHVPGDSQSLPDSYINSSLRAYDLDGDGLTNRDETDDAIPDHRRCR